MNVQACPSEAELLSFADVDLTPEQLQRVERHVLECARCSGQLGALEQLIGDLKAPVPAEALDVAAHVTQVMNQLDEPLARRERPRVFARAPEGALRYAALSLGLAAAVVGLALVPRLWESSDDQWTARGHRQGASLARDVGVQLYTRDQELRLLQEGSTLVPSAALTASLRNISSESAYLLLFGVDARSAVHWIVPAFTDATTNPASLRVEPGAAERPLPTSAVFDDVAPGQLRVVAVVSEQPLHVSDVEQLKPEELTSERLARRFAEASVRITSLQVTRGATP